MNPIVLFLNRYSNWRTFTGLLLLYLLFAAVLLPNASDKIATLAGKEIGPVDLTIGFNPANTLRMIEDYGEEARKFYAKTELTLDIAYPVIYALLFAVILTMIYRRILRRPVNYLNLLPFAALFFDLLENFCIVSLLGSYPEQSMAMATLCEIFKLIKFLLFAVILFLIAYGLIKLVAAGKGQAQNP